ncbi:hypothetical protein [Stutzerimonas urumqiensis]|uniref:hypothetical protein n=1 Tax=Stutzerimonas urumqiensis TaxID=638269 RepID=UPI000EB180E0|nr:hypothetical protein [Stutzerimonas urumqiensis]
MANRSKKTVLSARVSAYAKSCLDVLSAIQQQSQPELIEELLDEALYAKHISPPAFIQPGKLRMGEGGNFVVLLGELMQALWTERQELFKLRLHLVEPTALSERDQVITGTVFQNLDMFGGRDELFDKKAREMIVDSPAIPRVDLALVTLYWPLLTDYARFLANNSIKLSFPDFVDMLRKSGELDEIYDVL